MSLKKEQKRLRKLFKKWAFLVTDQGFFLEIFYYDNHLDAMGLIDSETTVMRVRHKWEYKEAKVRVNLSACQGERLEFVVVHELVHILMGDCKYESIAIEERVCSELTLSILRTFQRGETK